MKVEDLDTPFLIVDLDGLEQNLARAEDYCERHGIGLRPHIKTHKCINIARMQMERGAIGIAAQKLGEAEVMADGGVAQDILIPYNIVGQKKLERLTALARRTRVTVAADSDYTVQGLSEACSKAGVTVGVAIELWQGRTGVKDATKAVELAQLADRSAGTEIRGIMIMPSPPSARPLIREFLEKFDEHGIPYPIVSGGASPYLWTAHEIPELTEHRAGEYPVGGLRHLRSGTHTVEQCAVRVLMTVVSRPADEVAILDGGTKSLSAENFHDEEGNLMGHIIEYPQARFHGASEEHGHVDVSACNPRPRIGEKVQVIPVHPCPTFNEHNELAAVSDNEVETIWPIHARGMIR